MIEKIIKDISGLIKVQDKAMFVKQNIFYLALFYLGNIFSHHIRSYKRTYWLRVKGINLITIVAEKFKSTETTDKWELELSDIAQDKFSKKEFLDAIEIEI